MNGWIRNTICEWDKTEANTISESLIALETWSDGFWRVEEEKVMSAFAQKGFEDKGLGHIHSITTNAGKLLEKYHKLKTGDQNFICPPILKPTIILFYCAAHLHDIGMNYAWIYEALTGLIKAGGDGAIHIGKIIHDFHHYSTFIVLTELAFINETTENKKTGADKFRKQLEQTAYLNRCCSPDNRDTIEQLKQLNEILTNIYQQHFKSDFENKIQLTDFFIVLAILSLLHKTIKPEYYQSIINKITGGNAEKLEKINSWRDYIIRSEQWASQTLPTTNRSGDNPPPGANQVLIGSKKVNLNISMAEALLQFGDKTDISIARLSRKICYKNKNEQSTGENGTVPLDNFIEFIKYDNQKGFICTDMAQNRISDYARFRACRFIPVQRVQIGEDQTPNENTDKPDASEKNLNIAIHYLRFPGDGDIFKLLCSHNESDFYNLDFLHKLKNHLYLFYLIGSNNSCFININLFKKEHPFPLPPQDPKDSIQNDLGNITEQRDGEANIEEKYKFPYTPQNRKAIREFSRDISKPEPPKKESGDDNVFVTSNGLIIPRGFDIMAVLNSFQEETHS